MNDSTLVPCYVISLARATVRRNQIKAEFERIGMGYKVYDAVDGQANYDGLMNLSDPKVWAHNIGMPISAGHMGCYASHVSLWADIGKADDDIVLICEDDVRFSSDFPDALSCALKAWQYWDIVRLARIRAKGAIAQGRLGRFRLNAYWGPFTGNACYLIKKQTAAQLAERFYPIRRPHDHELNRFFAYDIRLMGVEPFTAFPDDQGESYITGKEMCAVRKFPKYKRLGYYGQKMANYPRRLWWLARHGMLRANHAELLLQEGRD